METNKELMRAEFENRFGGKLNLLTHINGEYQSGISKLAWEVWHIALSQRSEATEAQRKAELWDFFNARLLSRSGIVLNDKKDCQAAVDQWAEAHETHCTYKEKLRYAEAIALRGVTIHSTTISTPAPSAAAGEQVPSDDVIALEMKLGAYKALHSQARDAMTRWHLEAKTLGFDGVADALASIGAQPTPAQGDAVPVAQWIDASIKPTNTRPVLVDSTWGVRLAYCHEPRWANGCFQDALSRSDEGMTDFDGHCKGVFKVNRWMPLPSVNLPTANATRQSSADAVDAARYRWLRQCGAEWDQLSILDARGHLDAEALDTEIDAAIAAQGGKG